MRNRCGACETSKRATWTRHSAARHATLSSVPAMVAAQWLAKPPSLRYSLSSPCLARRARARRPRRPDLAVKGVTGGPPARHDPAPASPGGNRSNRRTATGCSLSDWRRDPALRRHSGVPIRCPLRHRRRVCPLMPARAPSSRQNQEPRAPPVRELPRSGLPGSRPDLRTRRATTAWTAQAPRDGDRAPLLDQFAASTRLPGGHRVRGARPCRGVA